jgi:hypothetical protein
MIQLIAPALAGARAIGGAANIARFAAGTGATLAGLLTASSANSGKRQNIQDRPVTNPQFLRPDYSGAGERARRFQEYATGRDIPGANTDYSARWTSGSSFSAPAAERAYAATKSSVAQQAAQNPEFQRYEKARKEAVAAGPGSAAEQSAEDMGMQMWAKANPKLAAKVKPGQAGYDAIQRTLGAGQMGSPMNFPFDNSSPLGTTPPVSPESYGVAKVAQGLGLSPLPANSFAGASAAPYAGFNQGQTLQSAPLGMPTDMPSASYAGATGLQPVGSELPKFDPKGAEAQKLLEMFKDSIFSTQK